MAYKHHEEYDDDVTARLQAFYGDIISDLGEDVAREGLVKTPERAAKAMQFLTQGYEQDAEEILRSAMFRENYSEMVIVKDIELYSLCEHHVLPFFGKAHVAYIPNGYIVGLSKIPRVIDVFCPPVAGTKNGLRTKFCTVSKTLCNHRGLLSLLRRGTCV